MLSVGVIAGFSFGLVVAILIIRIVDLIEGK